MNMMCTPPQSFSFPSLKPKAQMLLLCLMSLMPSALTAQVFVGNLNLPDQAAVDTFHYTEVTGSLRIGAASYILPASDIHDLGPLSMLTKVSTLGISHCPLLTSLNGLDNLDTVRFALNFSDLSSLTDISALANLDFYSTLSIIETALPNLSGLPAMTVLYNLEIALNPYLTDLSALSGLTTITRRLEIWSNAALPHLTGLSGLTSLGSNASYLYITYNPSLSDISALSNLSNANDFLFGSIVGNNLTEYCPLYNLLASTRVYSSFYVPPSPQTILSNGPCDTDADGIPDTSDNCPLTANPAQADNDGDGVGNLCDNCLETSNADQADDDQDGIGNLCDACPNANDNLDLDGNGIPDCAENCGNGNQTRVNVVHIPAGNPCNPQQLCLPANAAHNHIHGGNGHGGCYYGFITAAPCARNGLTEAAATPISLYPNPVRSRLLVTVESAAHSEATLRIYDLSGRLIQEQAQLLLTGSQQLKLNVQDLGPGIYQLSVYMQGQVFTEKFVKQD